MKEYVRFVKKILMLIILYPLKLLPVKQNRIVMINCLSLNYSDNIKPIAEYLIQNYPNKYEIFVCVNDVKKYNYLKTKQIKPLNYHSILYYFIVMSSKFFITNSGGYSYLPLKKSQIVINTWHGGGAYKKIGVDSYSADGFYKNELRLAAKKTNIFLSTNQKFTDVISNALLIPKQCFISVGMPRNDILLKNNEEIIKSIKKSIGISEEEKLVLYAPTYRKINDNTFDKSVAIEYGIDPNIVCESLSNRFGGKWKFAIRLHPVVKDINEFKKYDIIDLTDYDDMQELLLVSDVMINDFSSSMWDFMVTKKPCFIFAKDLQHYIDTTAVYTPVEEWPFPKSTSNEELKNAIVNFDDAKYKKDCDYHYKQLGGCETGKATEFVCDYINDIVSNNK